MRTLLLSPEQINDCQGIKWIREATPEESKAFKEAHPLLSHVDHNGRPYFAMTVDETHPEMPEIVRKQVSVALRIFRFLE